jgi:hypothetical protein
MRSTWIVALALASAAPAAAQAPGPSLPMAIDLARVEVGAWSEYTASMGKLPPFRQRYALVARDGSTYTLEMTSQGGTIGRARLVLQLVVGGDLARADRIRRMLVQVDDNPPMEMKVDPGAVKDQLAPVDPRKLLDTQPVKVPAGAFRARHYRDRRSDDLELWVADEAPPLGIVKMAGGGATVELTGRGKGARPSISRPPQTFDARVLENQMRRSMGGEEKRP